MLQYLLDIDEKSITVRFNDTEVVFYLKKSYTKTPLKPSVTAGKTEGIMDVANAFLASRTQPQQKAFFKQIIKIRHYVSEVKNLKAFELGLPLAVTDMYSVPGFTPKDITTWATKSINVPSSILPTYNDNDGTNTPDGTYLRTDYIDLVVMTIIFKIMLPILSAFLLEAMDSVGIFKEVSAIRVMPRLITSLPGYPKLYKFAKTNISQDQLPTELIYRADLNSEIIVEYIVANVLFSRLISGVVLTNTNDEHLIIHVYAQLFNKQKVTSTMRMKDKPIGKSAGDDDDGIGPFEAVRFKEHLSKADQVKIIHIGKPEVFSEWLREDIDIAEFWRALPSVQRNIIYIGDLHYSILRMVFEPVMSIGTIPLLDRDKVKALMLAAHLLLRDKHPYLSMIIISTQITNTVKDEETKEMVTLPIPHDFVTKNRLSEELSKKVARLVFLGYDPLNQNRLPPPAKNRYLQLVEKLSSDLIENWRIILPKKYLRKDMHSYLVQNTYQVRVLENGKESIAKFILGLDEIITRKEKRIEDLEL